MSKRLHSDPLGWIDKDQEEQTEEKQSKRKKPKTKDSRKKGLKDGYIRASLVLKEEYLDNLKAYAWWERLSTRDVLEEALEQYFKNKEVKPIPENRRNK